MLRLLEIRKSFGTVTAVNGLSLELCPGECFGLLGPNGAGKSTTVNIAIGLLSPDAGTVDLGGRGSPMQASVRQEIGLAPQSLALYDELTAAENLRFFGGLFGLTGRQLREQADWALKFVGLTDRRSDRVRTYSGGMKRRLNLAVAVIHRPRLLLLDEPTVGMDPQSRNLLFENVAELKRQGCTIVYTTHYMEEARKLCDRVGIIDHGRLLDVDSVESLIARHGGTGALIIERGDGEERIDTPDPLAELARIGHDESIRRVRVERPDLESAFLNLTGRRLRD